MDYEIYGIVGSMIYNESVFAIEDGILTPMVKLIIVLMLKTNICALNY